MRVKVLTTEKGITNAQNDYFVMIQLRSCQAVLKALTVVDYIKF